MRVELTRDGEKGYAKLNQPMLGRINDAIDELRQELPEGDIKPLKGYGNSYRFRVGGYRILFHEEGGVRYVFKIAPRGEAYRGKMNGALSVRDEIHDVIDEIPDGNLHVLRPLLDFLRYKGIDEDDVLSNEEAELLEQCRKDIREHPENFTPWEKIRRES